MCLHRSRRCAVRLFHCTQGHPEGTGGGQPAGGGDFHAQRRVQAYAGVSTGILIFTKTGHGGTDKVWFYDMTADGFSLDDKRSEIKDNDIPDIIARFKNLEAEANRQRTEKSFLVPKDEIVENGYDLSINKYKKTEYVAVEYPSTTEILADLHELEMQITAGLAELEGML